MGEKKRLRKENEELRRQLDDAITLTELGAVHLSYMDQLEAKDKAIKELNNQLDVFVQCKLAPSYPAEFIGVFA